MFFFFCIVATINRLIIMSLNSAYWAFPCFRNPHNSDKDRVFNVRTWSLSCVCIHTGVGHTDSESAQYFWLGKTHTFSLCSSRGSSAIKFHTAYTLRRKHVKCCHALILHECRRLNVMCGAQVLLGRSGQIVLNQIYFIHVHISDSRVCKKT